MSTLPEGTEISRLPVSVGAPAQTLILSEGGRCVIRLGEGGGDEG